MHRRVTILDGIKDLIENGLVTSRKAKKNSPNYNLYINNNYFKDLIDIHNEFERSFIELIDKIKLQIFTNEFVMNFKNDHQPQNQQLIILNVMYNIYSHFMAMVMLHAIYNWPEIIQDDEKRNTLNSILFAKMQKIHKSIYEAFQVQIKRIPNISRYSCICKYYPYIV